jgi:hypothetical protein
MGLSDFRLNVFLYKWRTQACTIKGDTLFNWLLHAFMIINSIDVISRKATNHSVSTLSYGTHLIFRNLFTIHNFYWIFYALDFFVAISPYKNHSRCFRQCLWLTSKFITQPTHSINFRLYTPNARHNVTVHFRLFCLSVLLINRSRHLFFVTQLDLNSANSFWSGEVWSTFIVLNDGTKLCFQL